MIREVKMKKTQILLKIILIMTICYTSLSFASYIRSLDSPTESYISSMSILSTPPIAVNPALRAETSEYSRLIDEADKSNKYDLVQSLFKIVTHAKMLDIPAYKSMLAAAIRVEDNDRAESLLSLMIEKKVLDAAVCRSMVVTAIRAENYKRARSLFKWFKVKGIFDVDACRGMIVTATRAKDSDIAIMLFRLMNSEEVFDLAACESVIVVAMQAKDYAFAEKALSSIEKSGMNSARICNLMVNVYIYDLMFIAACKSEDAELKERMFLLIQEDSLINANTCVDFIIAADKLGFFDKVKKIFKGVRKEDRNTYIYNMAIIAAKQDGRYGIAKCLFARAKEENCANKYIYASFIAAAGDSGFAQDVIDAFEEAKVKDCANEHVYANFITGIGDDALVKNAFKEAKAKGFANEYVYAGFIDAVGFVQDAIDALEEAKARGFANAYVYASFIAAAGDAGSVEVVKQAFKEAEAKDILEEAKATDAFEKAVDGFEKEKALSALEEVKAKKIVNNIVFNIYITALVKNRKIQEAKEEFERYYYELIDSSKYKHDFHGLDFATTYIAFCLMMEMHDSQNKKPVTIDIGKGSHSKDGLHVVKKAAELFREQFSDRVEMEINEKTGKVIIYKWKLIAEYRDPKKKSYIIVYSKEPLNDGHHWQLVELAKK